MSGLTPAQQHRLANDRDLNDDAVLARARQIVTMRATQAAQDARAERRRLIRDYAAWLHPEQHTLGGEKLSDFETLLVMALERTKYVVTVDRGRARWNGDATCKFHLRATVIVTLADSRHELLAALWAGVSGQDGDTVHVTEDHLRGSVVSADLLTLRAEFRAQGGED